MSHIKQVLFAAAGICLTATVILIYFTIFNRLQNVSEKIEQQTIQQEANIENYAIMRYDGCTIYGSQLIIYLKNNWDSLKNVKLQGILIENLDNIRTLGDVSYIDNNARYFIAIEFNENGVPDTIKISKVETN